MRRDNIRSLIGHTAEDIEAIRKTQKGICAYCPAVVDGANGHNGHVDYIVPLVLEGDRSKKNIQILCSRCRSSRQKLNVEYAKHLRGAF